LAAHEYFCNTKRILWNSTDLDKGPVNITQSDWLG
jgi:hypothetical protein